MEELNSEQLQAVKSIDGSVLILAGAGSGKTKTLINRVVYLINNGIDPDDILVLTFTNKASKEMRERALKLINQKSPLFCTFHKFGFLFLKRYIHLINRESDFIVLNSGDSKAILKTISRQNDVQNIVASISYYKNHLISPQEALLSAVSENDKFIADIYQTYEAELIDNNLVDFDDLLYLTYKILTLSEKMTEQFSKRFQYIMVDEYQDTNYIQLQILLKLSSYHKNICVVGDDDQSIYGFRGATVENILHFENYFENTKTLKLEKNYRSTQNILQIANKIISKNSIRHQKELIATKELGSDITYLHFDTQDSEAKEIAQIIKLSNYKSIGILYRINALSRTIEDALNKENIAYSIVNGVKFYEREEIRDLVSYFRVVSNPNDDFSLRRVLNRPKRGVGKSKIEKIESNKQNSIYEFLSKNSIDILAKLLTKKIALTLKKFVSDIQELQNVTKKSPEKFLERFFELIDIKSTYINSFSYQEKVDNIREFCSMFIESGKSLDEFLSTISIDNYESKEESENKVSLMSIHASKGLEFDIVFLIGLEEGILPILDTNIEEERRLCYVAITRAKEKLYICSSNIRVYGDIRIRDKSRFLYEGELIKEVKVNFKVGEAIKHKLFGFGKILEIQRVQKDIKLTIQFASSKKVILSEFVEKIEV